MSTFDNLMAVLGPDAAEKLVAAYGGIRIYIPVRAAPEGAFATLIGHAAAEALSRHYGGERFDVPIAKRAPRLLRGEICRLRRDGMHVTAIRGRLDARAVMSSGFSPTPGERSEQASLRRASSLSLFSKIPRPVRERASAPGARG